MDHPGLEQVDIQNERHKNAKRVYEKPAIIYSAPLEALAGVCGTYPAAKDNPIHCANHPLIS